jgi:hypothetical protein
MIPPLVFCSSAKRFTMILSCKGLIFMLFSPFPIFYILIYKYHRSGANLNIFLAMSILEDVFWKNFFDGVKLFKINFPAIL